MAILRKRKTAHFTMVANEALRDHSLSLKATGALVTLLSLPDGAKVSADVLAQIHTDGRAAAQAALRELTKAGYYRTERRQGEGGLWATYATVTEVPWHFDDATEGRYPTFGEPTFGGPPSRDEDLPEDLLKENTQTGPAAPPEVPDEDDVECGEDVDGGLVCTSEGLLAERATGAIDGRCPKHHPVPIEARERARRQA